MGSGTAPIPADLAMSPRASQALRQGAQRLDPGSIREVARQFEALFLREVLKDVRSTPLASDVLGSGEGDFYQEIFDAQLAAAMSRGQGIGLGRFLEKQLLGKHGNGAGNAGLPEPRPSPGSGPPATTEPVAPPDTVQPESAADAPAGAKARGPGATAEEFVQAVLPHARWAAKELGIAPAAILAQAALETAWGRRMPRDADGNPSFNLFGIKAGSQWTGAKVGASTLEYADGIAVRARAAFRAYESIADSVRDYVDLVKNSPRYQAALAAGGDAREYVKALAHAGYATDPSYADKLRAILSSPLLQGIAP